MKTEYEITFAGINVKVIKEKIKKLGWVCVKERTLMKRVVFESLVWKKGSYVRVRDEWDKITSTYKEEKEWKLDITSVKELEVEVSDFDIMVNMYRKLWLKEKAFQENYREIWQINDKIQGELSWKDKREHPGVEFMIDTWPWLDTYIEIEWENEEVVKKYTKELWFDYNNWVFGSSFVLYEKELWLDFDTINSYKEITFLNPPKRII